MPIRFSRQSISAGYKGISNEERATIEAFAQAYTGHKIIINHPRTAFQSLIASFDTNHGWLV